MTLACLLTHPELSWCYIADMQLPRMLGVIVGIRLGANSNHRVSSLNALELDLMPDELRWIDAAVDTGIIRDGLERT